MKKEDIDLIRPPSAGRSDVNPTAYTRELVAARKVVEAARAHTTTAVPQWAPELRAAIAAYDAAVKK